jgi:dCTP diphosphatase
MMLQDDSTTVRQLKELVLKFSQERNWQQFHHPKDLGVALICEVGELFEHFRYRRDDEIADHLNEPQNKAEVAAELADCFWLILRLSEVMQIDLAVSLDAKVKAAALKYPIEKAYGRSDKYTAYLEKSETPSESG